MRFSERYHLPGRGSFLTTILINALAACVALTLVVFVFGERALLEIQSSPSAQALGMDRWERIRWLVPGAALGFSWLWFWLVVEGRLKRLLWNGAVFYGLAIAFGNVPFTAAMIAMYGGAALGEALFEALRAFVLMLLQPTAMVAMACFGIGMGLFNANRAQKWLDTHRGR